MNSQINIVQFYKYMISSFDILIPGQDTISFKSMNIVEFTIEKDFDNDFFPILYTRVCMPEKTYYNILANKTTVKFKVRLDKYIYDYNNPTKKTTTNIFNELFVMYTTDNSLYMAKDMDDSIKDTKSATNITLNDFSTSYEFYLFKEKDMIASKKVLNTVLSKVNMSDSITYLLSKSGFSNILMSPMDNNKVYNQIIISSDNVLANIIELEQKYGFYNYGKLCFFDFNVAYFISKRSVCDAYKTGEYTNVYLEVRKSINQYSSVPGCYKDDKNKCYNVNIQLNCITMLSNSMISDRLEGNNIVLLNPTTGSTSNINPNVQQRGTGSTKVVVNQYNNPYLIKEIEYRKLENDNIIDVAFTDTDIECFAPNKRFIFSFEDSNVQKSKGGDYRLTNLLMNFKKDGDEFTMSGSAEFKKTK